MDCPLLRLQLLIEYEYHFVEYEYEQRFAEPEQGSWIGKADWIIANSIQSTTSLARMLRARLNHREHGVE